MTSAANVQADRITYRSTDHNEAVIIFLHGFNSNVSSAWGEFARFIQQDPSLSAWDVYGFNYHTSFAPDIRGIWQGDPAIHTLADYLRTILGNTELNRYKGIALVAHSMGGLVVQRALVDDPVFAGKVSHAVVFGTPSNGLQKASPIWFWRRQIEDMAEGSAFITDLRQRWKAKFMTGKPPFAFWSIAGDQDEFVPRDSSLEPFPLEQCLVISGNHSEITRPDTLESEPTQVLKKILVGQAALQGPWNSARVAVESRQFHEAIALFEPIKNDLDDQAFIELALAYEAVGRQDDAIGLLETQQRSKAEVYGVLAGRLKRRWLVEHRQSDAERTMTLYAQGYKLACDTHQTEQAFYHAINLALMHLAFLEDHAQALDFAKLALKHCQDCQNCQEDLWCLATQAEAHVYMGDFPAALERYEKAVALKPKPREMESMYRQAYLAACLMKLVRPDDHDDLGGKQLNQVFLII
jgi:hypothetical protein